VAPRGPGPLSRALAVVDGIGAAAAWAAAACLAALTLLIAAEIVLRSASNLIPGLPGTIPVAWEYSAYLMGNAFLLGAASTLRAGGHIRVGILLAALGPRGTRVLEGVATAVGLAACAFLAWSLGAFALDALARGQTSIASATPTWVPKAGLALGAAILTLQMAARLARVLAGLPPDAARPGPATGTTDADAPASDRLQRAA
jgi:TRAP-type C4-dicarboxylate transport system permease small subunit